MRLFLIIVVTLFASVQPVFAQTSRQLETELLKLDPDTRLEQVCDLKAMQIIGKNSQHEPDRAIADATDLPSIEGDRLTVRGGALRSHGHWYHLSYTCVGSPDHLKVVEFSYSLGKRIPESEWDQDNLWN